MNDEIQTLAQTLIDRAASKNISFGTAESCTGGWIGKALTDISGSSAVFMGGLITYSNDCKLSVLGIPEEILSFYGAVSEPVAGAMAQQARDLLSVDMAVSVTGIAGPGGGSQEKPVGMVCFGIAQRGKKPKVMTEYFGDIGRDKVRASTVLVALRLLEEAIGDQPFASDLKS